MIVVVGQPQFRAGDGGATVDGLPAQIALAAADHSRPVQLIGKAGEDPEGDAVVLALARGGVGHVALLRDAGMETHRAVDAIDGDVDDLDDATSNPAAVEGPDRVAISRQALDAVDIDLALRYLTEFSVVVLGEPADQQVIRVVVDAARFSDAQLIVVVPRGAPVPDHLPPNAVVFEAPDDDPDGAFAAMVGSFAAALDDDGDPSGALRASVESGGWAPAEQDSPES